ncbi:hypothetical protein [Klebsiella pneumoniae]|uniref:hypothetical protein n=1 Tax=Klebsiella pneumoniae TaxID=573 RepID=UPI00217D2C27|nr:hypothetical protein [Klebsiella pneumoniae]
MNNDGLTLNQLAERNAVLVTEVEKLRAERDQLAAENVALSKDAQRYRFIRERDMFGSDNESGLLSWEELTELECNEFDDALDARINHPNTGFIELDAKLQARETPATDRIVAWIKADVVAEREKAITFTAAKKLTQDGVALIAIGKPYKIHNDDVIGEFFIGERGRYGVITMDRLNYFATSDEYAWAFSLREGADK